MGAEETIIVKRSQVVEGTLDHKILRGPQNFKWLVAQNILHSIVWQVFLGIFDKSSEKQSSMSTCQPSYRRNVYR